MSELRCMDCLAKYVDVMACSLLIPKSQWLLIKADGGLLCANCMLRRAEKLAGSINVTGRITFGHEYDGEGMTPYDYETQLAAVTRERDDLRARMAQIKVEAGKALKHGEAIIAQRDEARAAVETLAGESERAETLERERDEARAEVARLKARAEQAEARIAPLVIPYDPSLPVAASAVVTGFVTKAHLGWCMYHACQTAGQLLDRAERAERERDEARAEVARLKAKHEPAPPRIGDQASADRLEKLLQGE